MRRLVRFGLVGASGSVVNLAVFAAAHAAGAPHLTAAVAAFVVSVSSNFALNRSWAFQARRHQAAHRQAIRFGAVSVGVFGVTVLLLELLVRAGVPALAAQAAAIATTTPLSFLVHRAWTFAPVPDARGGRPAGAAATRRRVAGHSGRYLVLVTTRSRFP